MTTIVFLNGVMAGDGRLSNDDGDILTDRYIKVRQCGRYVVGLCGAARHFDDVWQWYSTGRVRTKRPEGEWEALVWDSNTGCLFVHEADADSPIQIPADEPHSIGAGAGFARVAMECGKNAVEALEITKQFHSGTGGSITFVECKLQKRKTKPRQ